MSPAAAGDAPIRTSGLPRLAVAIIVAFSACKLLVHLYAGRGYVYFVDELYYLACSRHLDWGYVDQPPLIAVSTWVLRSVLGDSWPRSVLCLRWPEPASSRSPH